jgi:hypothetical protein
MEERKRTQNEPLELDHDVFGVLLRKSFACSSSDGRWAVSKHGVAELGQLEADLQKRRCVARVAEINKPAGLLQHIAPNLGPGCRGRK